MTKKLVAEFLGTFAIVFFGTAAICVNATNSGVLGLVGISLVFGLVVLSMIYAFGALSGAHFNPAVSIAFACAGRFEWSQVVPYVLSQCLGALVASLVVRLLFPLDPNLGATLPHAGYMPAACVEFILSFFLMMLVLQISTGSREVGLMAGIAVGSLIALEAMVGGSLSGASMNPARSFGPAMVSFHMQSLELYILFPTLGMVAASYLWRLVLHDHS